jgi:hypothetical protein
MHNPLPAARVAADFLFHDKTAGIDTWYDLCRLNSDKNSTSGY